MVPPMNPLIGRWVPEKAPERLYARECTGRGWVPVWASTKARPGVVMSLHALIAPREVDSTRAD